jgi:hypothetical protein
VVDYSKMSPRLGASFDLKGDGDWVFNASLARYVAALANNQADSQSKGGQPGTITWFYNGPAINPVGASTLVPTDVALTQLFNWFDSTGGVNNTNVRSIDIPGLTAKVDKGLSSPYTDEWVLGVSKRLGDRGLVRADIVHRESGDFYMTTNAPGQTVRLANGTLADLSFLRNDDTVLKRKYDGLHTQARYRINDRWSVGGNYTLAKLEGNFDGETGANGPVSGALLQYKEFKAFAQNNPEGYLSGDQRHRARAWVAWDAFKIAGNSVNVSLLQGYASGLPYGASAAIRTGPVSPAGTFYIGANPGYAVAPATVTYFFTGRDAFRTDDITRTDIAINYAFDWKFGSQSVEIFLQPEVLNLFDEDGVEFFTTAASTTVNTANNTASLQRFNPFTQTPVEGVHWAKGTSFGKPTRAADYQDPRTFRFSVGLRF